RRRRRPAGVPGPGRRGVPAPDGDPHGPARNTAPGEDVTRPVIGVTIAFDSERNERFSLRREYLRSVEAAGGVPLVLAPGRPQDARLLVDRVQALLFTGGSDVDPSLYGEAPHPRLGGVFRDRDEFELALCCEALERNRPILGICRGHQV